MAHPVPRVVGHMYALSGLLTKHRRGGSTVSDRLPPQPPAFRPHSDNYDGPHGPAGSRMSHAGMGTQAGSEPGQRQDGDTMQLNSGSLLPGTIEVPPATEKQPDPDTNVLYGNPALSDGSGASLESNDLNNDGHIGGRAVGYDARDQRRVSG
jgi:hypothetical protein